MERFEYKVDSTASTDVAFKTLRTDFGDGYSQEAGDGINARHEAWRIAAWGAWGENSEMPVKEIAEFIDRHAGYQAFEWQTPLGEIKLFRCRAGYALRHTEAGIYNLSATFEEVHAP